MRSPLDVAVNELARAQDGVVTRAQLITAGMSASTIWRRVGTGLLVPSGGRTFRVGAYPPSHRRHVAAACLDLGGTASHWTAAWLHRLTPAREPIDVTVRRARSVWSPSTGFDVRIHTSTNLPVDDITIIDGIPTTSVARTLLGLAALIPDELDAERHFAVLCTALERGLASERWLWWILAERRCRGRKGVVAFEASLARRARLGPTESWLEREVLRILARAGLPRPAVQRAVRRQGRFVARVDFVYPTQKVVVEALGYAFHRSRADLEADTRRANDLQNEGFRVLQLTFDQVVRDPPSVVTTVRRALSAPSAAAA